MSNYLSIFSGFCEEAPYLPEWLAHHINMGVQRFFLSDHHSTDDWKEAIKPFRDYITLFDIPDDVHHSRRIYQFIDRARDAGFHWTGHINIDEFLIPENFGDRISTLMHAYDDLPAVGIHWMMFGSNGHQTKPTGLVVENYTTRPAEGFGANRHVKTFVDLNTPQQWCDPHINRAVVVRDTDRQIITPVVSDGFRISRPWLDHPICHRHIRLHHYFTKSREEWLKKVARGTGEGTTRGLTEYDSYQSQEVVDDRAVKYAEAIRETLGDFGVQI